MNNQYGGPNSWPEYITALETAKPEIEVIGVTDYYVTETYQRVLIEKAAGRLPAAQMIFPNIELRLDVATAKGSFVNIHLFVSPEEEDHLDQISRILARLQFRAFDDRFDCTRADLIRLGRRADPSLTDDGRALSHGVSQFKVNLNELRDVVAQSEWAKKNIIIAVSGGSTDGTAGVREAADQTLREEIEKFAHVIFASSTSQREFWLGKKALSPYQVRKRYDGLKPCMHGSDAHKLADVALPFGNRFSWIKGSAEFDSLRQACIDPEGRAFVGSEPPAMPIPSQVIDQVVVRDAPWIQSSTVSLNPGLVAVIGARGSGKTALVDFIAAGCSAMPPTAIGQSAMGNPSFLARAKPLLGAASVEIKWSNGNAEVRRLDGSDAEPSSAYPRARYLSQQFVEELCSSAGMSDGLLREIERIVFEAHPQNERGGAIDFNELLHARAARYRLSRTREEQTASELSERIAIEFEKERLVDPIALQVTQKEQQTNAYTADRAKLVSTGNEARITRYNALSAAAENIRSRLRTLETQRQTYLAMTDEVVDMRRNRAPEALRQMQSRYPQSWLSDDQWSHFLLDYKGPVDADLSGYVRWAESEIAKLKGENPSEQPDETTPYFPETTDLNSLSLSMLEAELTRMGKLLSADQETQRQYAALSARLTAETAHLQTLREKLADAKGARDRARQLQQEREQAYERVFDSIVAEQNVLEELYRPLRERLSGASKTLQKLSFVVTRSVDIQAWATYGEGLLDLRKQGPMRGVGTLKERAAEVLLGPWGTGSAKDASDAMINFRKLYQSDLLTHAPVPRTEQSDFRSWSRQFAQWLFSTDHIKLSYVIKYDGLEIGTLSPGTRGVVLLLLYLALDDMDDRPLIIDQPEENLDPKSVYDELVDLFMQARQKRQVIIVTHNANLVVNTDADQILIARAETRVQGSLPAITYTSGGLEEKSIREAVCNILEGGEVAFRERARRLRVRLNR